MVILIFGDFFGEVGARANEAHVAEENIEKLGQFVDGVFANDFADASDAGVLFDFD